MQIEKVIAQLRRYNLLDQLADLEEVLETLLDSILKEVGDSEWNAMIDPGYRSRNLIRDADRIQEVLETLTQENYR